MINISKKYTEMNQDELSLEYSKVKAEYDKYCNIVQFLDKMKQNS